MAEVIPPYKMPKVYNSKKDAFVHYCYWSRSKQKYLREKVRTGQRGLSFDDRQRLLEALALELRAELKARNQRKEYFDESAKAARAGASRSLQEWLAEAQLDNKIEKNWRVTFSQIEHKLAAFYIYAPVFAGSGIYDVDEVFLEQYVAFLKLDGLATKTINKHLWGIETLSGWLKKQKLLFARIETKDFRVEEIKNETDRYPPLTHEEKELAFNYFESYNIGYRLMLMCQYYTCIRPSELHRLQVKDFDLKRKTIYVSWMESRKNGLSAYVHMLNPLVKELKASGLAKLPPDWYLFGYKCQPSPDQYEGQYASNTWTKQRTKMGMPKEKQSYGLKHTFNVDYVENNKYNIDWEFLRRHNRHATIQQTQAYIATLTAYFLDETKAVILDYTKGNTEHGSKAKSKGRA